jgi:hypothetical protein
MPQLASPRRPPEAVEWPRMIGMGIGEVLLIVGIIAVTVVPFVLLWIFVWGPMAKRANRVMDASAQMMQAYSAAAQLQVAGMPAQARVLSVRQTGAYVNMAPQCVVELEVYPGATPPYTATVYTPVPPMAIPRVQPGLMVPIRVDPLNPMHIALVL